MSLEIEVRFRIPTKLVQDRLLSDDLVQKTKMRDFVSFQMAAEYYDSPNQALQKERVTLRRRFENGVPHVSLKQAIDINCGRLLARQKWQCPADDVSIAIPALLDMGAPPLLETIASTAGFLSFGHFSYERLGVPLLLEHNTAVEFDIDDGVIVAGGKQEPMQEIVLKLLYGQVEPMDAFAAMLEEKYDLTRELSSKYERALRLLRSRAVRTQPAL